VQVAATAEIDHAPSRHRLDRARDDERLFLRFAATGDPADRDAIVERFLPLARTLAARYRHVDEPFDDVYQVACFALIKAVERYDAANGAAFSSYAVPTITGEIKRHFRDRTWSVRVPRDLQDLALRVDRVVGQLAREHGRQPSVREVAHATGVCEEEVLEAMQAASAQRSASLDEPRPSVDDEPAETMGEALGADDDGYMRVDERATLEALLRHLTLREREVLRLRFEQELSQAEIGEHVGLSQMQISRVLRRAIERLRILADVA
jgi:RNA polymerase sigma-B factor